MRFACVLVLLIGCGASASVHPPGYALREYVAALRANDADRAYALLDEETRARVSKERFREQLTENHAELLERAAELEHQAGEVVPRAVVPLESGEQVALVLEDGEWHVAGGALDAPVLRTPVDAVSALRRSLQRNSFRGVLRVLSRSTRNEIEGEIARLLEETSDALDLTVEARGNQARVRTSTGREIDLVRESGEWRIVDIR